MPRSNRTLAAMAGALALLATVLRAQESTPADGESASIPTEEQEAAKRLGFYFGISLERMSQAGQANGIGIVTDPPALGGAMPVGPELDGDFKGRFSIGFKTGFRLRNDAGRIEADFFQWDEKQDLFKEPPAGKVIANALASPRAGFQEDVGSRAAPGGPPDPANPDVTGVEAGTLSEGSEPADNVATTGGNDVLDGAEDWNFDALPSFIRFDTSDAIFGQLATDYQRFDLDYVRRLKEVRRFRLDWRAGLRVASVAQTTDVAYRDLGSFAVYVDEEGCSGSASCDEIPLSMTPTGRVVDGDGDGESGSMANNEKDGDGFLDGTNAGGGGFAGFEDEIEQVETVTEDRILSRIATDGVGIKLGLDGRYRLSKKWSLRGAFAVSVLSTDLEYAYRETFTSERDRYLNFIEWDLNGDGVYDNLDLDFDGDCNGDPTNCAPDVADVTAFDTMFPNGMPIQRRVGLEDATVPAPAGLPPPPSASGYYTGGNSRTLTRGAPIPESERNRDILRESLVLHELAGEESGIQPMLDLHVGLDFQFSKFASVSFGLRGTHWFDAGTFRSIASDVVAGKDVDVDGDFSMYGTYVMLTVVPR